MSSDDDVSAEERLIPRYFGPLATASGAFGPHDDAAVVTAPTRPVRFNREILVKPLFKPER